MKVRSFLKYVEIQTKLASVITFAIGTLISIYRYQRFNFVNFFLMFLSLLSFDMATTAINNYMDYIRARKKSGYGYEIHNAIVRDNISKKTAAAVIITLLAVAVVSGLMLFLNTNLVVLALGIISFGIGVMYSAGPVPISRTPFGEIFSGLFMGFLIPFLSVYIHDLDQSIVVIAMDYPVFTIGADIEEVLSIFLCSVPAVLGIANIMLANNICDMEDDLENKRYTLPLYIGKSNALALFKILYIISYAAVVPAIILQILPLTALIFFVTIIPIRKNTQQFIRKQSKGETFQLAVKNFAIMNASLIIALLSGIALRL
jgi:1,4-dihydroxy-2-naphthoate octaprenyltransferase